MQDSKLLYGTEKIGDFKLDYYKVKEDETQYAVEIVKTKTLNNKTNVESEKEKIYTDDETKVDSILETLKRNTVTPVGLKDSLIEISKNKKYI